MVVGGYTLHLYCDGDNCRHGKYGLEPKFQEFYGRNEREAKQLARKQGWRFKQDELCYCGGCTNGTKNTDGRIHSVAATG